MMMLVHSADLVLVGWIRDWEKWNCSGRTLSGKWRRGNCEDSFEVEHGPNGVEVTNVHRAGEREIMEVIRRRWDV